MTMEREKEREKEREAELESAMYTNCLLLGLDLSLLCPPGATTPRVGQFRHSNPKMGEQLLYFLLSSIRGPAQSAKDFDKVWPIFDSVQTRDFRKVVQSIITELESQGALPRSNSRVSSLATCCGPRFVELLWQLSMHAIAEVHRRTFSADAASNPLPGPLTDVSYAHAPALLPVTKARIALERRKFLRTANTAVQRQAAWANLAQDITSEFRGLCVEEAYLQQELEKLQDLRNKAKLEAESWDDRGSSSLSQNSHSVSKATRLWESLLARKSQHEVLASGPIEDLIAHREHRYRISGSALLAAMDQSSQSNPDLLSDRAGDRASVHSDDNDIYTNNERDLDILDSTQSGRVHPIVDIAEILRRWTHALQRVHKQSLHLAKANDGQGPELLRSASDGGPGDHSESLAATLSEHRQHLASIEAFVSQLKEVVPTMEKSIVELTEEVNSMPNIPLIGYDGTSPTPNSWENALLDYDYDGTSISSNQAQSSGRFIVSGSDEVLDITSRLSLTQHEKGASGTALKLPQLFSLSPNLSNKTSNTQRQQAASVVNKVEILPEAKLGDQTLLNGHKDNSIQGCESSYAQSIRRSVREAALLMQSRNSESSQDSKSDGPLEHYFVPFQTANSSMNAAIKPVTNRRKQRLFAFPADNSEPKNNNTTSKFDEPSDVPEPANGFLSVGSDSTSTNLERLLYDGEESQVQIFSPPLLMDVSTFEDAYEDLLAPLSEVETAMMER